MQRLLTSAMLLLLFGLLCAGCSGKEEPEPAPPPATGQAQPQTGTPTGSTTIPLQGR